MTNHRGPNNYFNTPTCHPESIYYCRGLCRPCYNKHSSDGTISQFPTRNIPMNTVIEAHKTLTPQGLTPRHIANHLGMTYPAYHTAIRRARDKGLIE